MVAKSNDLFPLSFRTGVRQISPGKTIYLFYTFSYRLDHHAGCGHFSIPSGDDGYSLAVDILSFHDMIMSHA